MLSYKVSGSKETIALVSQLLRNLKTQETDPADLVLVEKGSPVPETGVYLIFDMEHLSDLLRILNKISSPRQSLPFLVGRKHETFEPLLLADILFFRACGNTLFAHTAKQAYEMKYRLFEMEKLITCENFIRVNKSNIVNVLRIREIIPWFGGRILLRFTDSDERVEVSRNYVKDFKQFLNM
ncbi:MAG: LytTR family transcriptional regulator [Spirochaetales bacterium]|nr:LytTR family transcriptional regulator [Spirochaetales bacterium]